MEIDIKEITPSIRTNLKRFKPSLIYIYGSQVEQTTSKNSDLDIAFLSPVEFEAMEVFLTAQKISAQLNIEVDLVQLKNSSTVFQKEVVEGGEIIFKDSHNVQDEFELLTYKKYIRLNEERAEIINTYSV